MSASSAAQPRPGPRHTPGDNALGRPLPSPCCPRQGYRQQQPNRLSHRQGNHHGRSTADVPSARPRHRSRPASPARWSTRRRRRSCRFCCCSSSSTRRRGPAARPPCVPPPPPGTGGASAGRGRSTRTGRRLECSPLQGRPRLPRTLAKTYYRALPRWW
ncbi:unnamed protein product [Ectocarpus sp. 12 AP-2014]